MPEISVYDLIYDLLLWMFNSDRISNLGMVELVAMVLTLAFFYATIVYPIAWIFGFPQRRNKKGGS